ncbi:UNVERIFIED_CONTAM: hypothetical protein HDU68_003473 [Siphonaria sp. JEL0065]|nr:hypothetical protein HDU68_003473 [Siphonaria sp. JEL0065]
MPASTPLISLPQDIIEDILIHLPINHDLISVAIASKSSLALSIFASTSFARCHLKHQYASWCIGIWEFLDVAKIKDRAFMVLPFSYMAAIYQEILVAPEPSVNTISIGNEAFFMDSNRWRLSEREAMRLLTTFRSDPYIDLSVNDNRYIRWMVRGGHLLVVNMLLKMPSIDPSAKDNECILYATRLGYTSLARLLLTHPRVDPAAGDNLPIKVAVSGWHTETVRLLLQSPRVNPSVEKNFALKVAANAGYHEIVKLLLKASRLYISVEDGAAILGNACQQGFINIVQTLLEDGRVDPSYEQNKCLFLASQFGHVDVVKALLLDYRVDPGVQGGNNNGPIKIACQKGQTQVVELLLADARVNPSAGTDICIRSASLHGHVGVVLLLLADERVNPGIYANIALRSACENGHVEVVRALLADDRVKPRDVTRQNGEKILQNGHMSVINALLKHGGTSLVLHHGAAILQKAWNAGDSDVVNVVLQHPEFRITTAEGFAMLEKAVERGDIVFATFLLESSQFEIAVADAINLMKSACDNGHDDIANLVIEYMPEILYLEIVKESAQKCSANRSYTKVLSVLFSNTRLTANLSPCLSVSFFGDLELLMVLLDEIDKEDISLCIELASCGEHYEVVDFMTACL